MRQAAPSFISERRTSCATGAENLSATTLVSDRATEAEKRWTYDVRLAQAYSGSAPPVEHRCMRAPDNPASDTCMDPWCVQPLVDVMQVLFGFATRHPVTGGLGWTRSSSTEILDATARQAAPGLRAAAAVTMHVGTGHDRCRSTAVSSADESFHSGTPAGRGRRHVLPPVAVEAVPNGLR